MGRLIPSFIMMSGDYIYGNNEITILCYVLKNVKNIMCVEWSHFGNDLGCNIYDL